MANTFRVDNYSPARTPGYVAIALLGAIAVCSVFYFLFSIGMIAFPDAVVDLDDGGDVNALLILMGLVALLEVPLRLGAVVVFLIWLHRAYSNLSPLHARNLEFSPGWAIGWWFLPFANLVRPFQVVREVYNESDPDFDEETGFLHTSAGTPALIGFWWGTFLISGFAHRLADALYGNSDLPESEYFPVVFMVAGILSAIAALLAITIIRDVNKRQEARASKIAATSGVSDAPPAPPVFDKDL